MITDDSLIVFLLAPFIEDYILQFEGVPTGSVHQAVCMTIMSIAKKSALKGLSIEFLAAFFRNVDEGLASENMDECDIWFISTPSLLWGDIMVERAHRSDVV